MALRRLLLLSLIAAALPACAARSQRIAERGPKRDIRVSNTCSVTMRVYVDDDIKMRGQLIDVSTTLEPNTYSIKKLYDGPHRIVMVPEGRGGQPRQIDVQVTGPARIRICN